MSEIAIASVAVQKWEQPNEPEKALEMGSVFSSLNKPFFIEEQMKKKEVMPKSDCDRMLEQIQQVTFCLIDLELFLDTHPESEEAYACKKQLQQQRKELLAQFAQEFYPLTIQCEGHCDDAPAPWEGAC